MKEGVNIGPGPGKWYIAMEGDPVFDRVYKTNMGRDWDKFNLALAKLIVHAAIDEAYAMARDACFAKCECKCDNDEVILEIKKVAGFSTHTASVRAFVNSLRARWRIPVTEESCRSHSIE
jgi:hypothetical protein